MPSVFRFGKNWQSFNASYLNNERIELAKKSLLDFLQMSDLSGKSFLDVGAGSGLFSLAAFRLGASAVLSFDQDQDSVACCNNLRAMEGDPAHWRVVQGSILDDGFVRSLGQHDVVYSWGVLHHTGSMWKAIDNTLSLVKPGGCAYLAIYNKADGFAIYPDGRFGPSWLWLLEKKFYVSLPHFLQNCIDYCVMAALIALYVVTLHNPIRIIRSHQLYFGKGMSWRINIKDWLGGYPYEYATVSEVFKYAKERGFSLENLTCNNGLLNNEFLFRRT